MMNRTTTPTSSDKGLSMLAEDEPRLTGEEDEEEDVSQTNGSGTMQVSNIKDQAALEERQTLARAETQAVSWLRWIVMLIFLVTGILVSVSTYYYLRYEEQQDFESLFAANSERVLDSFHHAVGSQVGAVSSLSASITTYALQTETKFPFVTIPYFEASGSITRVLAGGLFIFWCPLVPDEQREEFENFAVARKYEITDGALEMESKLRAEQDAKYEMEPVEQLPLPNATSPLFNNPLFQSFHDKIWNMTTKGEPQAAETGPYLPILQVSPAVPQEGRIMNNMLNHPLQEPNAREVLRTGRATLGMFNNFQATPFAKDTMNRFLAAGQYRHEHEAYVGDSVSPLAYPVFDSILSKERKVAGTLLTNVYWRLFFDNILPPNVNGIVCVIHNSRNQSLSYRLNGPDVEYLGQGDFHDPQFDHLEVVGDVISHVMDEAGPASRGYTSADLNEEFITYTLHIYPSETLRAQHNSHRPWLFSTVIGIIFAFALFVFSMYNCLVERRQTIVMEKAVRSTAVVSSLFPAQVRDRLLNEEGGGATARTSASHKTKDSSEFLNNLDKKDRVKRFLESGDEEGTAWEAGGSGIGRGGSIIKGGGPPIADLYDNCTVLFMDIAGFTKWSSSRQPDHVFTLLETMYGEFDKLALRRGVFKIETIGDCYMAVTGLVCFLFALFLILQPQAQHDHAVRMTKFAKDCLFKINTVTKELATTLGEDTRDLAMRVGLHSGPVTAGVLRGDKARFQLFGDTVNTASRMETNGMKGHIHLSQTTADELVEAGKSQWLVEREGTVSVKGKGNMKTYYVLWSTPSVAITTGSSELSSHAAEGDWSAEGV